MAIARNPTAAATEYDYHFRILLIGDPGVGKRSIITRYANGFFTSDSTATWEYLITTVPVDHCIIKMEIWRHPRRYFDDALEHCFYRSVQGVMLVCDLTDKYVISNLAGWLQQMFRYNDHVPSKILIGNKCDLELESEVQREHLKQLADAYEMNFMEVSAKTGHNINEALEYIARAVLEKNERFLANPRVEDVQPLIKTGGINFQNMVGNTLLHTAVLQGNVKLGKMLLADPKCDVSIENLEGQKPLDVAIKKHRNDFIHMLIKSQNDCCVTALHHAAIKGYIDICNLCLTRRYWCDPNVKDMADNTPLHLAVFHNRIEIAQILAASKHCNPNLIDELGNTPLHVAVLKGNTELIKIVMSNKQCDLNLPNNDGETPLYIAIQEENVGVTNLLLKNKQCNLNFSSQQVDPPLHCAVAKGNLEICTLLLANDRCDPNIKNREDDAPLHVAIASENTAIVQTLVSDQRCVPNLLDDQGNSFLHYAVMKKYSNKLCKVLLSSNRCDPNIQNALGNTPLHISSEVTTARVLLNDKCCNPNLANHDGNTPLHLASAAGNNELCVLIIGNKQCNPNILNKDGATPLHIATINENVELMKSLLIHHDCNPNVVNKCDDKLSKPFYPTLTNSQGNTPLHSAVCKGSTLLCKIILSSEKCNINILNASGNTPLRIATWRGYVEVVHMLVNDKRYDPDTEDAHKSFPLHIACATGNAALCKVLLQQCNPNIQNRYGNTPLHIATIYGNNDVACILTAHGSCNPTLTNRHGNCPLHIAAKKGNVKLCKLFIAQEQSGLNIRNRIGKTALHIAASCPEYPEVLHVLVNHKHSDPNIQDMVGNTPLHIATTYTNPHHALGMSGHVTVCKHILSNEHCDPNIQNTVGSTPLHIGTSQQNLVLVQLLIEDYRCNPNLGDRDGNTPLHIAAANGNSELVNVLLSNWKSNSSFQNALGNTALHVAIAHKNLAVFKALISSEDWYTHLANIMHTDALHVAAKSESTKFYELLHTTDNEGSTPLHIAVLTDNKDLCSLLLTSQCCDPNSQDKAGNTPLHYAAWLKNKETVELLLDSQLCNPCIQDCHGTTPLHVATEREDVQLCKLLVSHRECDVNLQDVAGETPLHIATECIHPNLSILLIQTLIHHKNCNPNILNIKGNAPLHVAAKKGHVELCNVLLSHRECNINVQDGESKTPLHIAAEYIEPNVCVSLIQTLFSHTQCNPNIPDLEGNTPLHIAIEKGNFSMVMLILTNECCNPNIQNSEQKTPLHLALSKQATDNIFAEVLILHQQCDINIQDMNGNTPLHLAIQQCNSHIATMLINKKCNLTIPNSAGNTPLHITCIHADSDPAILKLARNLLSSTAVDPSCVNNIGQTPVELTTNYQLIQDISHFTECKTKHSVQTYIKLFILGNPSTGKSTLVKAICKEASFWWKLLPELLRRVRNVPAKTAGIIPTTFRSKTFGNTILYDLAGQFEYYSSHAAVIESAVFSSPPAFLVVIDLSEDDKKMITQLKYWWSFISNHAARASALPHVILVGSHVDVLVARGDSVDGKLSQVSSTLATLSSSFHFIGQVALDCRDPVSRGLKYLCSLVNTSCTTLRTSVDVDLHCHTLYAFLLERFANVVACSVSDIANQIRGTDMLLPKTPADLLQLLSSLSNRGLILVVRNSELVGNSWVILQKQALLNEVSGTIFAPENFSEHRNFSSTGIVPMTRLREEFPQYDTRMIVEFLTYLEFCFKVDDEEILYKINEELSANDTALTYQNAKTLDEFYFFPSLIGVDNPLSVWKVDDSMHYKCGWHCESTDPDKFLTTRFLHVLILRLAFIFTLKDVNRKQLSPVLYKRCSVWKHGIGWLNEDGVEVVVEVGIQNLGITVLMRCPDDSRMRCVELRSRVMHKILQTKEEFCPALEMIESFIHPAQIQYPVTLPRQLYLLSDLSNAIIKKGERVVDQQGQSTIRIEDLLFFEPYAGIDRELLNELFSENNTYKTVAESFLTKFAEQIDTRMPMYKEIIKPEEIPFEKAIKNEDIIALQCYILLQALCHGINPTYYNFHSEFDKFSIFCGRNPITRMFPTASAAIHAHR